MKSLPFQISLGSDPEYFLKHRESDKIVSAIPIIKKDKYYPIVLGDGVQTYYDCTGIETTVLPASSKEAFVNNIGNALFLISNFIGEDYEIMSTASHTFEDEQLEHADARTAGCSPEFLGDTVSMVEPPDFSGNLRSCGGHIAIGRTDFENAKETDDLISFDSKIALSRICDYTLGTVFTLIDNDPTSKKRREIYGKPSSHRPKNFGLEYRVLSNFWTSSPQMVELVYDLVEYSVKTLVSHTYKKLFKSIDKDMVNACIVENNKILAEEIVEKMKLPKHIMAQIKEIQESPEQSLYEAWGIKVEQKELVG